MTYHGNVHQCRQRQLLNLSYLFVLCARYSHTLRDPVTTLSNSVRFFFILITIVMAEPHQNTVHDIVAPYLDAFIESVEDTREKVLMLGKQAHRCV